jgi:phosphate transport system permease protein
VSDELPGTERTRLAVAGARANTAAVVGGQPRRDVVKNNLFAVLLFVAILLALAGLAALLIQAFIEGKPRLEPGLLTDSASSDPTIAGFRQAIIGSLMLIAGVIVLVVPLGIGAAVYLEEYGDGEKWWNRIIELNIQNLAAVPSIIYGILGLGFIVRGPLDLGFTAFAGSITLALLVLPIVIIAAREAIRAVPPSIREGSMALGATKWQTIRRQVLPASISGRCCWSAPRRSSPSTLSTSRATTRRCRCRSSSTRPGRRRSSGSCRRRESSFCWRSCW